MTWSRPDSQTESSIMITPGTAAADVSAVVMSGGKTDVTQPGLVMRGWRWIIPYLLTTPYALILLLFLVAPIVLIVTISFWKYSSFVMKPDLVVPA
jgi:hypothetical protein